MKKILLISLSVFMLSACSTAKNPIVELETSKGKIEVEVFANEVPETAKNFLELAKSGKYNNVPFHRVIPGFMIQGGDFTNKDGTGGYGYKGPGTKFADEFVKGLKNVRGTVSMANSGPNTNGSQFFINLADNPHLDNKHSVFAKVTKGMESVDAIANVKTGERDRPVEDVLIIKASVQE